MKLLPLLLIPTAAYAFFGLSSDGDDDKTPDLKVPGSNPLNFCEDPIENAHILLINSVDLSPNPPEAGKTLNIKASGNFTREIAEGAYVNIAVKLGLITLLRRREDLCTQMKEVDKECPLQVGETSVTRDVELPKVIPPGTFTVTADVFSAQDKKITCLVTKISFSKKSAAAAAAVSAQKKVIAAAEEDHAGEKNDHEDSLDL